MPEDLLDAFLTLNKTDDLHPALHLKHMNGATSFTLLNRIPPWENSTG
jgi:hypothetical protein